MKNAVCRSEFVGLVAEQVSFGIDRALDYWLGRIEVEVVDCSLSASERICAIEQIIREYKDASQGIHLGCASA